jgi:hypothetical protein
MYWYERAFDLYCLVVAEEDGIAYNLVAVAVDVHNV